MQFRALTLLAICTLFISVHSEEDAAADPNTASIAGVGGLAGYEPPSNVEAHSLIDLDIRDIELLGTDYAAATEIYENGHNSPSGDSFRTLQGFSTKYATDENVRSEPMALLGFRYWRDWDYSNQHVLAALTPTDNEKYGNYMTGALASTDDARKQIIKKVIKFQMVWQYAFHELEGAYNKYHNTGLTDEERYGLKGAIHALDEFWAFYAGSLEDGSQEAGEVDGEGKGYGPYILAEKVAPYFGTDGVEVGNGGTSKVNKEVLERMNEAKELIQEAGNEERVGDIVKCLRAVLKIPAIQGCLRYAYKASTVAADELAKYKAEGWAICGAALPLLDEVDMAAARSVRDEMTMTKDSKPDWSIVRDAFSKENLNAMGLTCADIGHLQGDDYADAEHVQCVGDDLASIRRNEYADVLMCHAHELESSASGSRAAMGLVALFALVSSALLQ